MSAICVIGTALAVARRDREVLEEAHPRALVGRAAQQRPRSACRARGSSVTDEARQRVVEERREVLRRDAEHARLVLVDREADRPWSARPSRTARCDVSGSRAHRPRRPRCAMRAHRRRCPRRTRGTAPESRPAARSRGATRGRAAPGNRSSKSASRRARTLLALLVALRDEHELREVRLLQLLVERQVEARAAGCRRRRRSSRCPARSSRIASSFFASRQRRRERAAFGQPQVDHQLGPRRRREELLRHEAEQRRARRRTRASVAPSTDPAMRDAPGDRPRASGGRTACR